VSTTSAPGGPVAVRSPLIEEVATVAIFMRYCEAAAMPGREVPEGEDAAWGGYMVLADSKAQASAWAEDCVCF
jgi:hypothetical protein